GGGSSHHGSLSGGGLARLEVVQEPVDHTAGALVIGEGLPDDLGGEIARERPDLPAQLRGGGDPLGAELLTPGGEHALALGVRSGTGLVDDLLTVGAGLLADGGGLLAGGRELLLLIGLELVDLLLDLLRVADTALDLLSALVQHGVHAREHELHEDAREDHEEDQGPPDLLRERDEKTPAWHFCFGQD